MRIEFQITHAILEINSDECVVVTGDASILFDAGLVTEKCPLLTMMEALEPENMLLS
ncbi:MAG: hypothetical protein ISF22_07230 [Methanomassiliicoccus sp.]|nr:hypothetical protein [Methanomassiliicoccus sp.]